MAPPDPYLIAAGEGPSGRLTTVVEEVLAGGLVNDAVRVDATVRRSVGDHTTFVHALLRLFEGRGWAGAPRALGFDGQAREVLTFIEGFVAWDPAERAAAVSEPALVRVAELTRELHDLTAGTSLAGGAEVVCHNDLAPRNTVYRDLGDGLRPVAFIDWDNAAPGERIHDLAHVCWQYVGFGPELKDVTEAAARVRLVCDAYGLAPRDRLLDTVLWWQDRCWRGIEAKAAEGDPAMRRLRDRGGAAEVRASFAWTREHRRELERRLG
jgi:Ser/Thr protein kinase RdoA (MazF antagonist)